jgi:DNA-binding NarL/FixJ family response regulator
LNFEFRYIVEHPSIEGRMQTINVAIVEDDARVRESIAAVVNGTSGFHCTGAYPSAEIALRKIPGGWPNVLIMDIQLPGISGIECVAKLKETNENLLVLMFTVDDDSEAIFKSLQAGATGYLLKSASPAEIIDAINDVMQGGAPMSGHIARKVVQYFRPKRAPEEEKLSDRELEIVHLLAKGFRYKEIADTLAISPHTVRSHIRRIYDKLHVTSRTEAAIKLGKNPLI